MSHRGFFTDLAMGLNGALRWYAAPVVTLTDAQIKALPTTPQTIIAAPGSGLRIAEFIVDVRMMGSAGAYTNVNADAYMFLEFASGGEVSNYLANDSVSGSPARTDLSQGLSGVNLSWTFQRFSRDEDAQDWGNLVDLRGLDANDALRLTLNNNGSGNLTGGNAGNTMVITPWCAILAAA